MSKEILMVVDAVSNEKGVAQDIIFEAIEVALASATRKRHGEDVDVRVSIDRESGDYLSFRRWEVVSDELAITDPELIAAHLARLEALDPDEEPPTDGPRVLILDKQVLLSEATKTQADVVAGDFIEEPSNQWPLDASRRRPLNKSLCKRFGRRSARKSWTRTRTALVTW